MKTQSRWMSKTGLIAAAIIMLLASTRPAECIALSAARNVDILAPEPVSASMAEMEFFTDSGAEEKLDSITAASENATGAGAGAGVRVGWLDYIFSLKFPADLVILSSPLTSYADTVLSIQRTKSARGFSLDLCGIMLAASLCRIWFYFGEPYETALLAQAVVMVVVQLVVLALALKYRDAPSRTGPSVGAGGGGTAEMMNSLRRQRSMPTLRTWNARILELDLSGYGTRWYNLWQWTNPMTYLQCIILSILALSALQLLLGWSWVYIQTLGFVGLLIEAVLPVPQIMTNFAMGSVQGFRLSLVASWLAGDVSKLTYFAYATDELAIQFVVCGVVRLLLDLFVGIQYVVYQWISEEKLDELRELPIQLKLPIVRSRTQTRPRSRSTSIKV